jgi:hypothetical protein
MANSTATIFIKPAVAFNRGDTFIFGSWVCTADGVGSFQRRLTMTPNPKTGLVTLPEVVTGDLAGKFGDISLYSQHADFELRSDSNSNLTSPWAIACEPAIEPSCADSPLHEYFPYVLCIASKAHAKALSARRAGKEIASEYDSDSNPISGYYSDSSYEFDFGADPDEAESETYTMKQSLSGPALALTTTNGSWDAPSDKGLQQRSIKRPCTPRSSLYGYQQIYCCKRLYALAPLSRRRPPGPGDYSCNNGPGHPGVLFQ